MICRNNNHIKIINNIDSINSCKSNVIQLPQFSYRIFYSSWLSWFSVIGAYYNKLYDNFILNALCTLFSIIYWYDPIEGYRRKLDIIFINGTLLYQINYTVNLLPTILSLQIYYLSVIIFIFFYICALYFGRIKNDFNLASKCHVLLHIFGNISNLILYDAICHNHLSW